MGPFWKRARHQKAADCEEVEVGIAMTPSNVVNTPEVEIIDGLVAERPDNSDWKAGGLRTKSVVDSSTKLASELVGEPQQADSASLDVLRRWFQDILDVDTQRRFLSIINPEFHSSDCDLGWVLHFLAAVAQMLRANPHTSIVSLTQRLAQNPVPLEARNPKVDIPEPAIKPALLGSSDSEINNLILRCVFVSVGWITMLYRPCLIPICDVFAIDTQDATCFSISKIHSALAQRSLLEILRHLGDILPIRSDIGNTELHNQMLESEKSTRALHVASLNVATLKRVGDIKLDWTDILSAHLDFQPGTSTLKLFRLPSLCSLHTTENSVLSKVLENYYSEAEKPRNFTVPNLMKEVILSYSLLFRLDSRARNIYRRVERKRASIDAYTDPVLDGCCLKQEGFTILRPLARFNSPVKESFDAFADFPILGSRLMRIQAHIDGIQPNRIASLWRDKRDILRWYTFWAVVWIGGLNLVIAALQAGLAAAQVKIALQSLQEQQA